MHKQASLNSVKLAIALRQSCIDEPYSMARFGRDLIAGVTVGIIAIPLAMALAIASGVPPQHGLYTAIIAEHPPEVEFTPSKKSHVNSTSARHAKKSPKPQLFLLF